jgi:hypothetical protein
VFGKFHNTALVMDVFGKFQNSLLFAGIPKSNGLAIGEVLRLAAKYFFYLSKNVKRSHVIQNWRIG